MVRTVLTSLFVVAALALGGCASGSQVTHANTASTTHIHSAPIPGEMEFNFDDSREAKQPAGDVQAISFRTNSSERPTKGAVHPAMR